jgi:hypothetical protein
MRAFEIWLLLSVATGIIAVGLQFQHPKLKLFGRTSDQSRETLKEIYGI